MAHPHGGSTGGGGHPPSFAYINTLTPPPLSRLSADSRLAVTSVGNSFGPIPEARAGNYFLPAKEYFSPHSRYPTTIASPGNLSSQPSADVQTARDFRIQPSDIRDKRNDSKQSTDQAVQQHFDESLRLANHKLWQQQSKYDEEQLSRSSSVPSSGPVVSGTSVLDKPFYCTPSSVDPSKGSIDPKVSVFSKGSPVIVARSRDGTFPVVHRREQPDGRTLPPPPPPGGGTTNPGGKTGSGYNFTPSSPRAKVSSPAPPQIYGKPDARSLPSVPSSRHYDPNDLAPLPLTSKNTTVARNSPPVTSSTTTTTSLPQHEVRSAELTNFYMHSSGPSGFGPPGGMPPSQTQPLDLGGKRKPEYESVVPPSLEPKKIKNEEPLDLKSSGRGAVSLMAYSSEDHLKLLKQESQHGFHGSPIRPSDSITTTIITTCSVPPPVVDVKPVNLLSQSANLPQGSPYNFSLEMGHPPEITSALIIKPGTVLASKPAVIVTPVPAQENPLLTCSSPIKLTSNSPPRGSTASSVEKPPSIETTTTTTPVAQVNSNNNNNNNYNNNSNNSTAIPSTTAPKKHWLQAHKIGTDGEGGGAKESRQCTSPLTNSNSVSGGGGATGLHKTLSDTVSSGNGSKNGHVNFLSSLKSSSNTSGSISSNINVNKKPGGGTKNRRRADDDDDELASARGLTSDAVPGSKQSQSSESEDEDKSSPAARRIPPKGKRKNGKKHTSPADTTESDKGGSDSGDSSSKGKDSSPSQPSTPQEGGGNNNRKRGRKGRDSPIKNDRRKSNPFKRPPIKLLKKSGDPFLQDGACNEVAPKLNKCRECRWSSGTRSKKQNPFCRFYAFRKLHYKKSGALAIHGFSDPMEDAAEEDKNLWMPSKENLPKCLEFEMSKTLIEHLGDQFCELVKEEKEAIALNTHAKTKGRAAWKRVVPGVRDMCDVCETTLFNYHWACEKCGFVVCIACYKSRKNLTAKNVPEPGKDRDKYNWLFCSIKNRQCHELDQLMLTQVIAGDSLNELWKLVHKTRDTYSMPQLCGCNDANQQALSDKEDQPKADGNNGAAQASKEHNGSSSSDESDMEDGNHSTLRSLLSVRTKQSEEAVDSGCSKKGSKSGGDSSSRAVEDSDEGPSLKHFVRTTTSSYHRQLLPIRSCLLAESKRQYPNLPHSWLCLGRLLKLENPLHPDNVGLFQDMWKRGQPVLVANVAERLDQSLWTPESFSKDSRLQVVKSDLVNCISGKTLASQPIRKFWEGFDNVDRRLRDDAGQPMLLKLKDWPPGEDFADLLPERFKDLMQALPLTDYTDRNGRLNLAARLPSNFVRPDLGPKMYIAYGSGDYLEKGTTNLHLDISDAVNVMVHVGVPQDVDNSNHIREVKKAIAESDCDQITINKVLEKVEHAGALWHIYNSRDADKIRDLLNKEAIARGDRLEPNNDPIHDQSWYLDRALRKKLMDEYDVCGYPIIQCLGDAVFIPAGAPHQVRNLNNCIKIAEDFVSPENVSHCFDLTEEFRRLSDTHQNHEDKLQIKNIVYHAVKDAISVLIYSGPEGANSAEPQGSGMMSVDQQH